MTGKLFARSGPGLVIAAILVTGISATWAQDLDLPSVGTVGQRPSVVVRPPREGIGGSTNREVLVRPPARQTISLTPFISKTIDLQEPYAEAEITNSDIIDVGPVTDRTVTITPKKIGQTNIIFRDEKKNSLAEVNVVVTAPPSVSPPEEKARKAYVTVPGRIAVHNGKNLGDATIYSCAERNNLRDSRNQPYEAVRCVIVGEAIEKRDVLELIYGTPGQTILREQNTPGSQQSVRPPQ